MPKGINQLLHNVALTMLELMMLNLCLNAFPVGASQHGATMSRINA